MSGGVFERCLVQRGYFQGHIAEVDYPHSSGTAGNIAAIDPRPEYFVVTSAMWVRAFEHSLCYFTGYIKWPSLGISHERDAEVSRQSFGFG